MKRAVIYARVSTQRQADDGVSMESQIEQCRIKAHALQHQVGIRGQLEGHIESVAHFFGGGASDLTLLVFPSGVCYIGGAFTGTCLLDC
jgi:hypothetical protein